ncbi:hypothetical protein [Streptacidiphilus carbonis]|uniref:hypothetical protein n=1 Tax=Streptacidiphilus carbonis TaxID=105422 RepID=UPI0005AA4E2E|nr:hypothetical protein [Streptacidiphilus carbonis]
MQLAEGVGRADAGPELVAEAVADGDTEAAGADELAVARGVVGPVDALAGCEDAAEEDALALALALALARAEGEAAPAVAL